MLKHRDVIALLYEAAYDPAVWPSVLDAMVACAGGTMGAIFFQDRKIRAGEIQPVTATGFSSNDVAEYVRYYFQYDPRLLWAHSNLGPGRSYADDRDLPFSSILISETYQDYYRPLGLGHCLGGSLFKDTHREGFLTIHRGMRRGGFSASQLRHFEGFLPHVIRALQLRRRLAGTEALGRGLSVALDHAACAALLVTEDGRLTYANRAADELLSAPGAALRVRDGRLSPGDGVAAQAFAKALRQAGQAAMGLEAPPPVLLLKSPDRQRDAAVLLMALPGSIVALETRLILLFMVERSSGLRIDTRLLMAQFGLSKAEADIAAALSSGETPDCVAARRHTSTSTVRTQAKAIYGKLDVNSQAQLSSKVAASLAALRPTR